MFVAARHPDVDSALASVLGVGIFAANAIEAKVDKHIPIFEPDRHGSSARRSSLPLMIAAEISAFRAGSTGGGDL
jgi:hypothetical protein